MNCNSGRINYSLNEEKIKVDIDTNPEIYPFFAADLIIRSALERNISLNYVFEEVEKYVEREIEDAIRSRTDNAAT